MTQEFAVIARRTIAPTTVFENVAKRPAVVLERIARGGGATNWYFCKDSQALEKVVDRLRPASLVSFYFDGRIWTLSSAASLAADAAKVIADTGECVVGALLSDGIAIEVDFVAGRVDLDDLLEDNAAAEMFFAGPFPGRDNDGTDAVTVTLPDEDGVVRRYAY